MSEQSTGDALLAQVVDYVFPLLSPYETSLYLYLLRRSRLEGSASVRVGKRTIGNEMGKATRSTRSNYNHVSKKLDLLAEMGFIAIGDTDRNGTLYSVALPTEVPAIRESMAAQTVSSPPGHYRDPDLRKALFERDEWRCKYCGESVTLDTATLDHVQPVSNGGDESPDNLVTACLMCNSIKAGRTYEEVAPLLLSSVAKRRAGEGSGDQVQAPD